MRTGIWFTTLPSCLFVVVLASCGKNDSAVVVPAATSNVMATDPQTQSDIKIVQYGPRQTSAGYAFNAQASGQAALWMQLAHPAMAVDTAIWWGDYRLESAVSGTVISAVVPAERYAIAGRYPLQVRVGSGVTGKTSNVVYFVVK